MPPSPLWSAPSEIRLAYDLAYLGISVDASPAATPPTLRDVRKRVSSALRASAANLDGPDALPTLDAELEARAAVPFGRRPFGESSTKIKSMRDAISALSLAVSEDGAPILPPSRDAISAAIDEVCACLEETVLSAADSASRAAGKNRESFAMPLWPIRWIGGDDAAAALLSSLAGHPVRVTSRTYSKDGACEATSRRTFGSRQFRERRQAYGIAVVEVLPDA